MKKVFSTLLLFAYFVAVLLATQELSSSHHDSQLTQQSFEMGQIEAHYSADLDLDHNQDNHSNSGSHGDCCVVGCSHHPGMITVVSSAILLDNSALFLFSQFIYQAPDLATLKRPPIA